MKKFNLVLSNKIDKVKNDEPLIGVTNKTPIYDLRNTYEKIVFPNSELSFNKILRVKINEKKENVTVKATLLKKVFDY